MRGVVPGPDAPAPLTSEQVLSGRYRLVRPIARGGMADVWEGHDQVLSRNVAIKVLQRQFATDEVFRERFRREAVAAARLAHPSVVATFDAGVDGTTTYIVMELVRGDTLRRYLAERGPLPPWLAIGITTQIADALVQAHQAGIIHRDIKPANILVCEYTGGIPRVKVTDFGIAKAAVGLEMDLTRTGMVLGTPRYLSPEQVQGIEPDARADLYALGVVTFEMLTGRSPFEGATEMAMAMARLSQPAPHVRSVRSDVPRRVDGLVAALLATKPERRTPSAAALRLELDGVQASLPGVRRHAKRATATAGPMAAGAAPPVTGRGRRLGGRRQDVAAAEASNGALAPTQTRTSGRAGQGAAASPGAATSVDPGQAAPVVGGPTPVAGRQGTIPLTRPETSRPAAAGTETSRSQTAGTETSRSQTAGTETSRSQTAGTETSRPPRQGRQRRWRTADRARCRLPTGPWRRRLRLRGARIGGGRPACPSPGRHRFHPRPPSDEPKSTAPPVAPRPIGAGRSLAVPHLLAVTGTAAHHSGPGLSPCRRSPPPARASRCHLGQATPPARGRKPGRRRDDIAAEARDWSSVHWWSLR